MVPCVSADGKLTVSGKKLLTTLETHPNSTAQEIAQIGEVPLFRVRSGLRELLAAGFVSEMENRYSSTDTGKTALKQS